MDIKDILESFEFFDGQYKREQVSVAIGKREEITPHLLTILKKTLEDAAKYAESENYYAHIYALFLLAHFKEPKAHQLIIDLFNLPGDIPEKLFGDTITEDLPVILLRTYDGNLESIKKLVLNTSADEYCRRSAARAIAYGVVKGVVPREEAISFYRGIFTGREAGSPSGIYGGVARCIHDIYPEELMETIQEAFKDGIIDSWDIGLDAFKDALLKGKEKCIDDLKRKLEYRSLNDLHKTMSSWACFKQDRPSSFAANLSSSPLQKKNVKKKKKKRKKKKLK